MVLSLAALDAKAAVPRYRPPKPVKLQPAYLVGTITSVTANQIVMTTNDSKTWTVYSVPDATAVVTGKAKPDFLKPGLIVKFTAELDNQNATKDKVREMSIVPLSKENPVGVFPPDWAPQGAPGTGGKPASKSSESDAFAAAAESKFGASQKSKVVGRITSVHGDRLTLHAGTKTVRCDLTADPQIHITLHVSLSDPKFISAGDGVSVRGTKVQGKPGVCNADDVKITLAKPLTGRKKKHTPSPSQGKPNSDSVKEPATKSTDGDDGLPEPGTGK